MVWKGVAKTEVGAQKDRGRCRRYIEQLICNAQLVQQYNIQPDKFWEAPERKSKSVKSFSIRPSLPVSVGPELLAVFDAPGNALSKLHILDNKGGVTQGAPAASISFSKATDAQKVKMEFHVENQGRHRGHQRQGHCEDSARALGLTSGGGPHSTVHGSVRQACRSPYLDAGSTCTSLDVNITTFAPHCMF